MEKTHHKLWDKNDPLTGTGFAVTVPGVLFCASIDIRKVYWFDENCLPLHHRSGDIRRSVVQFIDIETNENDGNT